MKTLIGFVWLSLIVGLIGANAWADDFPPSEEDVCDELQLPGVTPGLYGLCNAYCEAKDCDEYGPLEDQPKSCQRLYANYVKKATGPADPPEPPCLVAEAEPLVPPCACWPDDLDNSGIPDALEPDHLPLGDGAAGFCFREPDVSFYGAGFMDNIGPMVTFILDGSGNNVCDYGVGDGPPLTVSGLTPDEFDDCLAGITYLHQEYEALYGDFPCPPDGG